MTSNNNYSGETIGTENPRQTRKVFTVIVKSSKTTLVQQMSETSILTLDMDVSLRENMMRHYDKPDCPFWKFDV